MAYIPPHKRLKDPTKPPLVPVSLVTEFKKKLNFKSSRVNRQKIFYSNDSISKWFLVDSNGIKDDPPPYVNLVPYSSESIDIRNGEKPLVLKNSDNLQNVIVNVGESKKERTMFLSLAEKVEEDLLLAYERAKTKIEEDSLRNHVLRLVARFGRIIFYECEGGPVTEGFLKNSKKVFSADVPTLYLEQIKSKVLPGHGFCLDEEKEVFFVEVTHYTRPNEIINCKCFIKEDGRLSMYKVYLKPLRHMVVDVSCLDKNLDMRLMLSAKIKMTTLTEEELGNIREVLASATVDPNVKDGLKWPYGRDSSKGGYRIIGAVYIRTTVYRCQNMKLWVKERGIGEVMRDVTLNLKFITTKLEEENLERGCVAEMIRDALGTVWDFLNCDESDISVPEES